MAVLVVAPLLLLLLLQQQVLMEAAALCRSYVAAAGDSCCRQMAQQLLVHQVQMQLAVSAISWAVQLARQDAVAWTRRPHHLVTCCACLLSRLQQQLLPQVLVQ
jgi:hypothetical protein